MEYPKLYIKERDKRIKYYLIYVKENKDYSEIIIENGIEGKNINKKLHKRILDIKGKHKERAIKKAKTIWLNKKKEGFTENKEEVKMRSEIILPMRSSDLNIDKIEIPACIQYKLDGIRAMSHYNKELKRIEYISRKGKELKNLKHIDKKIEKYLKKNPKIWLDGELYTDKLSFNEIKGLLQRKEYTKDIEKIDYKIFDIYNEEKPDLTFEERYKIIEEIKEIKEKDKVKCNKLTSIQDIEKYFNKSIEEGHEGIIIRNYRGKYTPNKKNKDIFKTKEFKIGEFKIKGYKEGTGDSKGTIIFELKCKNINKTFWAVVKLSKEESRKLYNEVKKNEKKYIGKSIKVKYYKIDKITGCVTRNPIVII